MIELGLLKNEKIPLIDKQIESAKFNGTFDINKAMFMFCYLKAQSYDHLGALNDLGFIFEFGVKQPSIGPDGTKEYLVEPDKKQSMEFY